MIGFLTAFVATLLLGTGARDQVLIAGLTARLGRRVSLLTAGLVVSALTVFAAAWLATLIAAQVQGEDATSLMLLALGLAGLEMVMVRQRRLPTEPTRSLGAITLVLLAFQMADAVRLASLALVLIFGIPIPTATGAAFGAMTALGTGWILGERFPTLQLAAIRRWLGIALAVLSGTFLLIPR